MTTNQYASLGTAGTVTAAGADVVVSNHLLICGAAALATLPNSPQIDVRQIESATLAAGNAETAGVITVTPTNAASSEFSLQVTQLVNGVPKIIILSTTTAASGSSATTICDAWRAQLAANTGVKITGSGTATFIMTAQTGYPIIKAQQVTLSNPPVPGTIAVVATTPGVLAKGTYAALVAQGVNPDILVAGQTYSQFRVQFRQPSVNDAAGDVSSSRNIFTLLINGAATNYAALATRIGEIINGYGAGGTTADPEFLALS